MKLADHKDLKVSILALPVQEKDRLLLRLVAKDKILTEHLHFKLLEDEHDLEDRKEKIKTDVIDLVLTLKGLNAKEALTKVRKIITSVNHFYKVTKDVVGEVELKLFVLDQIPLDYKKSILAYRDYSLLFAAYYIKTLAITLRKLAKLHEDHQFDLTEMVNHVLDRVYQSRLASAAELSKIPRSFN